MRGNLRKALVFLANVVIESDKQGPMSPQTLEFSQIFFYTHLSRFCTHTPQGFAHTHLSRFCTPFEPPREEVKRLECSKINFDINLFFQTISYLFRGDIAQFVIFFFVCARASLRMHCLNPSQVERR